MHRRKSVREIEGDREHMNWNTVTSAAHVEYEISEWWYYDVLRVLRDVRENGSDSLQIDWLNLHV